MTKIIKHKLFRISTTVIIVLLLSWGVSSVADDNMKSATNNFSAMGLVSEISNDSLEISSAKGSDKSGNTVYDLNIDNLEKIQTNKNEPLNFTDIKEGDKIIVQGLTNGSTFFIKRLISFSADISDIATTTIDLVIASSTATSTEEVAVSEEVIDEATATVPETTTENDIVSTSTATTSVVDENVNGEGDLDETSITTDENILDTSTSTDKNESSTSTPGVMDTVINTVIDTVMEVIENIVDTITGDTSTTVPEISETVTLTPEPVQDISSQ